jgi:hypothetical protein
MNDELKWGGILCNINYDNVSMNHIIVIKKITEEITNYYNISFEKNIIFYRNYMTKEDKTRDLFISYLDYSDDL